MLDGILDGPDMNPPGKDRTNSFDDSYSLEDSYSSSFGGGSPVATGDSILGNTGRVSSQGRQFSSKAIGNRSNSIKN